MPALPDNLAVQASVFDTNARRPSRRELSWPHRPALIRREISRLGVKRGRAIDLGCGNGLWLAGLGRGWEKHGVDLSPATAQVARGFSGATVTCVPLESYKAPPGSFDLVIAFAIIEHLVDPRQCVGVAWELLKPDGLLVMMTGDRESRTAVQMGRRWPLYSSEEHLSFFSARSLGLLVQQVGFEIVRREWRFMYPPSGPASALKRWERKAVEVLGSNDSNIHDHFFLYARKTQGHDRR